MNNKQVENMLKETNKHIQDLKKVMDKSFEDAINTINEEVRKMSFIEKMNETDECNYIGFSYDKEDVDLLSDEFSWFEVCHKLSEITRYDIKDIVNLYASSKITNKKELINTIKKMDKHNIDIKELIKIKQLGL